VTLPAKSFRSSSSAFMSEPSHILRVVAALPKVIVPSLTVPSAETLLQPALPWTAGEAAALPESVSVSPSLLALVLVSVRPSALNVHLVLKRGAAFS
jgi:hypothetical protein